MTHRLGVQQVKQRLQPIGCADDPACLRLTRRARGKALVFGSTWAGLGAYTGVCTLSGQA